MGVASAATFNVSTTQELRQALIDAAQNGQSDTIILADGTYATTDDGGGTFNFLDYENYDLTIKGSSPDNVVLSGDNTDGVLKFNISNSGQLIYLNHISIINGKSSNLCGGIFSYEALDIENCIISGNTTESYGGGFWSDSYVVISNSTISDNTTGNSAGGFWADGNVTITNSTISGNTAGDSGGGFYATGNVTISDSTISDNAAGSDGGGFVETSNNNIIITNGKKSNLHTTSQRRCKRATNDKEAGRFPHGTYRNNRTGTGMAFPFPGITYWPHSIN